MLFLVVEICIYLLIFPFKAFFPFFTPPRLIAHLSARNDHFKILTVLSNYMIYSLLCSHYILVCIDIF